MRSPKRRAKKPRKAQRVCGDKIQYGTRAEARAAAIRLDYQHREKYGRVAKMSAYKCPSGKHWHVGHTPKGRR